MRLRRVGRLVMLPDLCMWIMSSLSQILPIEFMWLIGDTLFKPVLTALAGPFVTERSRQDPAVPADSIHQEFPDETT